MMTNDIQKAIRVITGHAEKITRGFYDQTDELLRLTDETKSSPEIARLAEAFGMMSVKVEVREFDLKQRNAELEESLKLRTVASSLMLWLAIGVSLYIFILAFFYQPGLLDPAKPMLLRWFGIGYLVSQVVLMTILIRKSGFPLSAYGLTKMNWKKSLKEGLLATGAVVAGLILLKILMINSDTPLKGKSLIAVEELKTLFFYTFILSAPLQEFLVRGVMQSSAERILMGKGKILWSVVSVSLIFAAIHSVFSLPFALLTLAASLLWGWLYARHHNLIGVAICHLFMGLALILLGFWEILAF